MIHFAYSLGGRGAGRALSDSAEIAAELEAPTPAWVHLQADDPESDRWIDENLDYLPEPVRDALTLAETRPRLAIHGDGVLMMLKGVNPAPGAEPEDMISVRIWADPGRVVTLSRRPLAAIEDLRAAVAVEGGPDDAGALLCLLIERLSARIAVSVTEMDDHGDACEEEVLQGNAEALTSEVGDLRAATVDVRRVLIPQRDAVAALKRAALPMIAEEDRLRLDEAEDVLRRLVEEIEALRDRLVVLTDEIASQRSDRLNRNLYILSVVSVIFLPLGFLTGLMGINVAGMPGATWPPAFWTFCAMLAVIVVLQVWVLWWMRILRFPSRGLRSRLFRQKGENAGRGIQSEPVARRQ